MMSRGVGLISVLLAMTVALAACDGGSSGTSQAAGVANTSVAPTAAAAQSAQTAPSNDSTSVEEASATPLPCDAAATASTPCSAAHSV
jgi:hypothetical protein